MNLIASPTPLISVVTPTLNGARFLRQCLDSVVAQEGVSFEHIVMDGGSTDGTQSLLSGYPHLTWCSEEDHGEAEALNKASALAKGQFLLWLNGDDWLEPGAFIHALPHLTPGNAVVYGAANMVDEAGTLIRRKTPLPQMDLDLLLRWWNNPVHPHQPSMFFSREALAAVGPFREDLHFSIDYEFWLRLAQRFPFQSVDAVLSNARLRQGAKSSNTEDGQVKSHWRVLLPFLEALEPARQEAFWMDYFLYCAGTRQLPEPWLQGLLHAEEGRTQAMLKLGDLQTARDRWWAARRQGIVPTPQPSTLPARQEDSSPSIRIAGEGIKDADLTEVGGESTFARSIRDVFRRFRPQRLIETGTYHGTGTTAILAGCLKDLQADEAQFFSIEVNPRNVQMATANLGRLGLGDRVTILNGLSLPAGLLPDEATIEASLVHNLERDFQNVYVDHPPEHRAHLYFQETHVEGVPEDVLGRCLRFFDHRPDFVLLDSGGHLGFREFQYLVSQLEGPCLIALDDIRHVKHCRSFDQMRQDPRFEILVASDEKFGFCIARFDPGAVPAKPAVRSILWIRTDAIGDALLANAMLPRIASGMPGASMTVVCQETTRSLYEACPHVSAVISYDRQRAYRDEAYRRGVSARIQEVDADLCLNSVFSREPIGDVWAQASAALKRVAHAGDCHNMTEEQHRELDPIYTHLIPSKEGHALELDRHQAFLESLGIDGRGLAPLVWTTEEDEQYAEHLFQEQGLTRETTVALFAGAQFDMRVYPGYGEALKGVCNEGSLRLVALGSARERDLNQAHLAHVGTGHLNLCGDLTLRQCAAILRRCRLAVGAETGLAHMACAVGTPQVVVLGGGHFGRFMPYSPLTSLAVLPLACILCDWKCPYASVRCVKDLHPDVLEQAVRQTLAGPSSRCRIFAQTTNLHDSGAPQTIDLAPALDPDIADLIPIGANPEADIPPSLPAAMSPDVRTTVICAVWHKDPDRFDLLRGHQSCLDAQMVPVERVYVFDGGDQPPEWLKGRCISLNEPLGLYEAWNAALALVRTPYVMNLNLDDRLNPEAVAVFQQVLDDGADLVGGDWRICFNQPDTDATGPSVESSAVPFFPDWPPVANRLTRLGSGTGERGTFGPACAWRMSLHETIPRYPWRFKDGTTIRIIGDAVWWGLLRQQGKSLKRVPALIGRYHSHPEGQAEFRNPAEGEHEKLVRLGLAPL